MLMRMTEHPLNTQAICPECGWRSAAGQQSCGNLRDQLPARDYEQPVLYWRFHRLAIDAYCLQHSAYVASAKSLAAHLCGLCVAFEHGNDLAILRQVQQWLSLNPDIHKPALPVFRGKTTIADVYPIEDPAQFGSAVEAWARSVWEAYGGLQPLAREWPAVARRKLSKQKN